MCLFFHPARGVDAVVLVLSASSRTVCPRVSSNTIIHKSHSLVCLHCVASHALAGWKNGRRHSRLDGIVRPNKLLIDLLCSACTKSTSSHHFIVVFSLPTLPPGPRMHNLRRHRTNSSYRTRLVKRARMRRVKKPAVLAPRGDGTGSLPPWPSSP